jgi:hypothetical protein
VATHSGLNFDSRVTAGGNAIDTRKRVSGRVEAIITWHAGNGSGERLFADCSGRNRTSEGGT